MKTLEERKTKNRNLSEICILRRFKNITHTHTHTHTHVHMDMDILLLTSSFASIEAPASSNILTISE